MYLLIQARHDVVAENESPGQVQAPQAALGQAREPVRQAGAAALVVGLC